MKKNFLPPSTGNDPFPIVKACFLVLFIMVLLAGCRQDKPPIKIGFVANLTGQDTKMATGARNGALLAVDDMNRKGGVDGRPIELIVKDDHLDPATAVKADQELIRENVAAVIGHVHSKMSLAALPIINHAGIVMLSPVSASSRLEGLDDYFFKINPPSSITSIATAKHAFAKGLKNIAILRDLAAGSYGETKSLEFKKAFESLEGRVSAHGFAVDKGFSFPDLVRDMLKSNPDGYFIIANALNTAMLCQHLRKLDAARPIFITPFAYDEELLANGGGAVEGVILAHSFQPDSAQPDFLKFKEDFIQQYKTKPGIWETFGYECVMVLAQALAQNPGPRQLKQTLLKIKRFKGLQGDIVFDRYGDNQRKPVLLTIRKGGFVESK